MCLKPEWFDGSDYVCSPSPSSWWPVPREVPDALRLGLTPCPWLPCSWQGMGWALTTPLPLPAPEASLTPFSELLSYHVGYVWLFSAFLLMLVDFVSVTPMFYSGSAVFMPA